MKPIAIVVLALMFPCVSTILRAAEQAVAAKNLSAGRFQVEVTQGYLSVEANQALLVQIFQEIGKQAKITFDSNIGPEEKVTIRLERAPLEDGIKQLAKNVTVFYTENPKDKSRRISRVVVLSEGTGVSGQVKASSQPEKASGPAPQQAKANKPPPQPAPFKFEFDPGKFTEKEKLRKQQ